MTKEENQSLSFVVNFYLSFLENVFEKSQDEKHLISICITRANRSISSMLAIRQNESKWNM